jgi:hypothetical protein
MHDRTVTRPLSLTRATGRGALPPIQGSARARIHGSPGGPHRARSLRPVRGRCQDSGRCQDRMQCRASIPARGPSRGRPRGRVRTPTPARAHVLAHVRCRTATGAAPRWTVIRAVAHRDTTRAALRRGAIRVVARRGVIRAVLRQEVTRAHCHRRRTRGRVRATPGLAPWIGTGPGRAGAARSGMTVPKGKATGGGRTAEARGGADLGHRAARPWKRRVATGAARISHAAPPGPGTSPRTLPDTGTEAPGPGESPDLVRGPPRYRAGAGLVRVPCRPTICRAAGRQPPAGASAQAGAGHEYGCGPGALGLP